MKRFEEGVCREVDPYFLTIKEWIMAGFFKCSRWHPGVKMFATFIPGRGIALNVSFTFQQLASRSITVFRLNSFLDQFH